MKSSRNSELDDWTKLSVKFLSLFPKIPVETINLMNSRIPSFFNLITASVVKSKSCPISSMDDLGSVPNPKYILITFSWLASSSFSMIRIASSFVDISNCKTSGNNVNQKKNSWNQVWFKFSEDLSISNSSQKSGVLPALSLYASLFKSNEEILILFFSLQWIQNPTIPIWVHLSSSQ